jgi:hypothetical protein
MYKANICDRKLDIDEDRSLLGIIPLSMSQDHPNLDFELLRLANRHKSLVEKTAETDIVHLKRSNVSGDASYQENEIAKSLQITLGVACNLLANRPEDWAGIFEASTNDLTRFTMFASNCDVSGSVFWCSLRFGTFGSALTFRAILTWP